MKNFIEYDNCVFVLAIDKAVIDQGLRSKYDEEFLFGSDETDKQNTRTRADKFFDKIIQIPYTLPEKSYDLTEYMGHLLNSDIKEDAPDYEEQLVLRNEELANEKKPNAKDYADFLNDLGLRNPRSIKRYFNLEALYSCMRNEIKLDINKIINTHQEWYNFCLFVVTTLQIENRQAYETIFEKVYEINQYKDAESKNNNEILAAIKNTANDNNYYIDVVISIFEKASATIPEIGENMDKWLSNIFVLSNYNGTFNEKQLYIKRIRELLRCIENDNACGLDFTDISKKLEKSDKELADNFGSPAKAHGNNSSMLTFGGGTKPRPYLILSLNGKSMSEIETIESFENYNSMLPDNTKNYYLSDIAKGTVSLYISGNKAASHNIFTVLQKLGFIRNIPDINEF